MARGPKKHMKRIRAPKSWMIDKLGGVFGPHKLRHSLPLHLILSRKLKYSLNGKETKQILNEKSNEVKVDGKVRRNHKFPVGLMDVLTIEKTGDRFRLFYDEKRRFTLISIKEAEANLKVLRINKVEIGANKIPYMVSHDARTIRFPKSEYHVHDSVLFNIQNNTIEKHFKMAIGNKAIVTNGHNLGRIGSVISIVKKLGGVGVVTLKDQKGHTFNTRIGNVFIVGDNKPAIELPRNKGVLTTVLETVKKQIEAEEHDE